MAIAALVIAIGGSIVWAGFVSPIINDELHSRGLRQDSNSPVGVSFDSDRNWPGTMPTEVPRVAGGEIWDTVEEFGLWNVRFRELPDTAADTLKVDLERNYWTITGENRNEEAQVVHLYAEYGDLLLDYQQNMNADTATLIVEVSDRDLR